jgi:hypothetical protein
MNSRLPKLNVGLPLFGGAEYLKSPIRCRLEQDLDAFELILVVSNSDWIAMNAKEWSQVVVAGSLLLWGAGAEAIAATYTTNFPLTENPIFEGGHWINGLINGLDW